MYSHCFRTVTHGRADQYHPVNKNAPSHIDPKSRFRPCTYANRFERSQDHRIGKFRVQKI